MAQVKAVQILYTNYRGETRWRWIIPERIHFGATPHHPAEQWLLDAQDVTKNVRRTFAVRDIKEWKVA